MTFIAVNSTRKYQMLGDTFSTFVEHIYFTVMLSPSSSSSSLIAATLTLTFFAVIFDVREFALQYVKVHDGEKHAHNDDNNDNISLDFIFEYMSRAY